MNTELTAQPSWWKNSWKWLIPMVGTILISITIFFTSGMDVVATDLAQAYSNPELYENALQKANSNKQVKELLGELKPIDKLAILEGHVEYSNNNKAVNSSIRVVVTKGKAMLDIAANRIKEGWHYTKIQIRIKTPPEKKQLIEITLAD